MRKTWLIARHEFLTTIRRVSYILFTLALPVLAILGMVIYVAISYWGAGGGTPEELKMGYVDNTGMFTEFTGGDGVVFIPFDADDAAREALLDGLVNEYFVIPQDYVETGRIERYTTQRELELPGTTMAYVKNFLLANLLSGDVSQDVLQRAQNPLLPVSVRLDAETGEVIPAENPLAVFVLPYAFGLLFMMSLFVTSGFLLQGVSEEKENRLIEILLSSVSARQLMSGKVLGLGAAGLAQVSIWLITGAILLSVIPVAGMNVPIEALVFGIIYFILGYLLFGTIWAFMGSVGSSARESSQWTTVVVMPAIIPIMLIGFFVANPDHVIFTILILFPLTAPVMAVMRLSIAAVPAWELALSLAILVASVLGSVWLAARAFRTLLLMYGKRPSFRDVWRYVREG